jgi:hypothetical protein
MKKIIKSACILTGAIALIICSVIIYINPKSCNTNDEFNMKYTLDKEYITFNINRKDNKSFKVYEYTDYDIPSYNLDSTGYLFKDGTKFLDDELVGPGFGVQQEDGIIGDIITFKRFSQLSYILYEKGSLFSKAATPHINGTIKLPLEKYSNNIMFSKKIEIKKLINNGRYFVPPEKRNGEQEIIVRINLIHEPMLQECSKFETNPIKVLFDLKD